jgi:hypothetical protein
MDQGACCVAVFYPRSKRRRGMHLKRLFAEHAAGIPPSSAEFRDFPAALWNTSTHFRGSINITIPPDVGGWRLLGRSVRVVGVSSPRDTPAHVLGVSRRLDTPYWKRKQPQERNPRSRALSAIEFRFHRPGPSGRKTLPAPRKRLPKCSRRIALTPAYATLCRRFLHGTIRRCRIADRVTHARQTVTVVAHSMHTVTPRYSEGSG